MNFILYRHIYNELQSAPTQVNIFRIQFNNAIDIILINPQQGTTFTPLMHSGMAKMPYPCWGWEMEMMAPMEKRKKKETRLLCA